MSSVEKVGCLFTKPPQFSDVFCQLNRCTVSSAFYWNGIEQELRNRGLLEWTFTGSKDESLDGVMKYIDALRCSELYSRSEGECSDDCRKRGIYIYMMDIYTYMCMYICMVYTQNPRLKRLTFLVNMLQLLQGVQILF